MSKISFHLPNLTEQQILDRVEVILLSDDPGDRARYEKLMSQHHYLESDSLVGEQLRYIAVVEGQWLALLSWSAASKHLRHREEWIGWDNIQRRRRLALLANNSRFLILPGVNYPNLASKVLALNASRLSSDWQNKYNHPILAVKSFVDSQLFRGTCYKAQGWQLLGETKGFERSQQDYYTEHKKPKQLWVRELQPNACKTLCAEHLPSELQAVEDKMIPLTEHSVKELRNLLEMCREVPDWIHRKGRDYPLQTLIAIIILATLCGVVRGQRDLAAFAAKLTQPQLRALRSYRGRDKRYHAPKETTFYRILTELDPEAFEKVLRSWEIKIRGIQKELGEDTLVAIDGKTQRGSDPESSDKMKPQIVSALSLPSTHVLGSVLVEKKSNEIPAARVLLEKIGPQDGKTIMLDALHSNQTTIRQIHQENGADYLLPVKANHAGLAKLAQEQLPPPPKLPPPPPAKPKTNNIKTPEPTFEIDLASVGLSPLGFSLAEHTSSAIRYRRK